MNNCADTAIRHIKAFAADYYDVAKNKPIEAKSDLDVIISLFTKRPTECGGKLSPLASKFYSHVATAYNKCDTSGKMKLHGEVLKLLTFIASKFPAIEQNEPPAEPKSKKASKTKIEAEPNNEDDNNPQGQI